MKKIKYVLVLFLIALAYKAFFNQVPISNTLSKPKKNIGNINLTSTPKNNQIVIKNTYEVLPSEVQSTPNQSITHQEFLEIERKFAQKKLSTIILGWCSSSPTEVSNYYLGNANVFALSRLTGKIPNPHSLCLNKDDSGTCFTYMAYCPGQFQETDDLTLLQFYSASEAFKYEQRVMDYKNYIENPDDPNYPDKNYWRQRADALKNLAQNIQLNISDNQN